MNTIRLIIFLSVIFFSGNNVLAQSNFLTGHFINIAGDTIHGEIDYRNWDKNPNKITFRNLETQQITELSPHEIQSFSVSDEIYLSARVETEKIGNSQFEQSPSIETIIETVFLQTFISGEKSLFLYKNEDSRENFYIKENGEFYLLKYKKYNKVQTVNGATRSYTAENKFFLGQLGAYLNECSDIQKDINITQYKKESLSRLIVKYNECTGTEIKFEKPKEKTLTKFGVLGGVSMTSLSFSGINHPNLTEVDYGISTNPVLGLSVDFIFPRNMRKWGFSNELMLAGYQFQGNNINEITGYLVEHSETKFEYTQIKINSMIQYSMYLKSTELFLHGGMSFGFAVNETNQEYIQTFFYETETSETRKAVDTFRVGEMGFLLGTGIRLGKISGEIRYENGNGMSDNPSLSSPTNKVFILIGYRF